MPNKKSNLKLLQFVSDCQKNRINAVDLTLAYRVDRLTNRVATFDWSFSQTANGKEFEYMDEPSSCWFDDGYPIPVENCGALPFTNSSAKKGSQFDRVNAFMQNYEALSSGGIGLGRIIGHDVEPLMKWVNLVITCLTEPAERKKYDAMFSKLPKTQLIPI